MISIPCKPAEDSPCFGDTKKLGAFQKQTPLGKNHPKASQNYTFGNLAILALNGFRSTVLRRHLSVTLPFRLKNKLKPEIYSEESRLSSYKSITGTVLPVRGTSFAFRASNCSAVCLSISGNTQAGALP